MFSDEEKSAISEAVYNSGSKYNNFTELESAVKEAVNDKKLGVADKFKDEMAKVTLKDSTVREDSFRLGIGWGQVDSEITETPINEVFNKFKVTLSDSEQKEIGTLDLALDDNPGTDEFINKMKVASVDATSIRYDSQGVDAKGGVTGWYKSAYKGGKKNQPKYAKIEVEDKHGNKETIENKIND